MEKRRRDKINYYLNELADLVPSAADRKVRSLFHCSRSFIEVSDAEAFF